MNIPKRLSFNYHVKGAKLPPNSKRVTRNGHTLGYANPHYIIRHGFEWLVFEKADRGTHTFIQCMTQAGAHQCGVNLFALDLNKKLEINPAYLDPLLGLDFLACGCPLGLACHVDALIEALERRAKELEAK